MAKLTSGLVKKLHDNLGAELADFFATAHGVEDDSAPDDEATETEEK